MGQACPRCGKPGPDGPEGSRERCYPFCSERCRLIDLGAWLDGAYVIESALDSGENEDTVDPRGETG